jgi:sec-independent protein translocase protein TatB
MTDSLILMVLALVVFGPRRLPEIGRKMGKLMYEFRKASNDFKFQMEEELRSAEEADRRKKEEAQLALAPAVETEVAAAAQQVAEATPELPSKTGEATTAESPYPGEYRYPEMLADEVAAQKAEATAAETPAPFQTPAPDEQSAAEPVTVTEPPRTVDETAPAVVATTKPEANLEANAAPTAVLEPKLTDKTAAVTEPATNNG